MTSWPLSDLAFSVPFLRLSKMLRSRRACEEQMCWLTLVCYLEWSGKIAEKLCNLSRCDCWAALYPSLLVSTCIKRDITSSLWCSWHPFLKMWWKVFVMNVIRCIYDHICLLRSLFFRRWLEQTHVNQVMFKGFLSFVHLNSLIRWRVNESEQFNYMLLFIPICKGNKCSVLSSRLVGGNDNEAKLAVRTLICVGPWMHREHHAGLMHRNNWQHKRAFCFILRTFNGVVMLWTQRPCSGF